MAELGVLTIFQILIYLIYLIGAIIITRRPAPCQLNKIKISKKFVQSDGKESCAGLSHFLVLDTILLLHNHHASGLTAITFLDNNI